MIELTLDNLLNSSSATFDDQLCPGANLEK